MLCGIRNSDNQKVFASKSVKTDGPFSCLGCRQELNIRKGRIKVHHFAHKPPYSCTRGQGETEAHRKCKETIYNSLLNLPYVTDLDVEKDFGTVISDVYGVISGAKVAIEIQRSNLSVNDITSRTSAYEKLGIHVLWLALFNDKLESDKYSPKAWEKWCHAVYFGRVYYWLADLTIIPVHYDKHQTYVEPKSYFDQFGQENYSGDYYKTLKRYRTPNTGTPLNLGFDFQATSKSSWSRGTVHIPKCKIYVDKLKKWW